jgi:hypothetical protein
MRGLKIGIGIIIVLIFLLLVVWLVFFISPPTEGDIFRCNVDSDCMLLKFDGCCASYISINKFSEEEYWDNPKLQEDDFNCEVVRCKAFPSNPVPICIERNPGVKSCGISEFD